MPRWKISRYSLPGNKHLGDDVWYAPSVYALGDAIGHPFSITETAIMETTFRQTGRYWASFIKEYTEGLEENRRQVWEIEPLGV